MEGGAFLIVGPAGEGLQPNSQINLVMRSAGDQPLQHHPPQVHRAVDQSGRHIDDKRAIMTLKNRQGDVAGILLAVIDGEHRKAPVVALDDPLSHLVERDNFKAVLAGLLTVDPVQGENQAKPAACRLQREMRAGMIERAYASHGNSSEICGRLAARFRLRWEWLRAPKLRHKASACRDLPTQ